MGLNLSSTLDFNGYISRSLVSVIGKICIDAKSTLTAMVDKVLAARDVIVAATTPKAFAFDV